MDAATITAIFAGLSGLVVAVGTLVKNSVDIKTLKQTIDNQGRRITELEAENKALKAQLGDLRDENEKLTESNKFLQAVLTEYQEKLIPAIHSRRRRASE